MSFDVAAESYGRFMGRFSEPLAALFVEHVDARPGQDAVDVGCGPGALTALLAERLGPGHVRAVDPSASFVEAARRRLPGVDVQQGSAEQLPFADDSADLVLAQLVVHFMTDPVAGIAQMLRVARPGGLVAATVWDHSAGRGPLSLFWQAVTDLDPGAHDESGYAGVQPGHLAELVTQAGGGDVQETTLTVRLTFAEFDEWWQPFTLGVGPAGSYVAGLDDAGRDALRERCRALAGSVPFTVEAAAWTVVARA